MARGRKAAVVETGPVEGLWELPDGWRWEPLGSLAEFVNGAAFKPADWVDEGTPIVRIQNLTDPDKPLNRTLRNPGQRYRIASGDLLVSWSATLDAFVWKRGDAWLNQHIFKVIPEPRRADADFLFYLLKHEIENLKKSEHLHGSTMKHINRGPFLAHVVPVPPLDTQRRIVARIDELFSELDDGEAALDRARADLETYRKSLLKAAVTGELTADWRAANPPAETGEQLLQHILAERKARWEADPKNKGKRYKAPEAVEIGELAELPTGWIWASFGQIFDRVEAGLNVKALSNPPAAGETGIVKLSAVTWWDFNEDASKTLISGTEYDPAALIENGDFLISRANTLELVGAPAIVRGLTRRLVLSDKVLRLVMPERLKKWCFFVLRSPFGRTHIESLATGNQLSMRNISQDSLRRLPIPIPPSDELERIIDLLTASLEAGTEAGLQAAGGEVAANQLRQSILAAAFRGELVQ